MLFNINNIHKNKIASFYNIELRNIIYERFIDDDVKRLKNLFIERVLVCYILNRIVVNIFCNFCLLSFVLKSKLSFSFFYSKSNSQLKIRLDLQQILKKLFSCNKKTRKNNLELIKLNTKKIFDANDIKTNASDKKILNIETAIRAR